MTSTSFGSASLRWTRVVPAAAAVFFSLACGPLQGLLGPTDSVDVTKDADALAMKGDLPGAAGKYAEIAKANPASVYALEGDAYAKMMAGDFDGADAVLADAEKKASEGGDAYQDEVKKIKVRRALVALRAGKLDNVKKFGKESEEPVGQVLAAEVHLADAEGDDALKLFKAASTAPGVVGETAKTYVSMLESDDQYSQGLAEATALWALGQRDVAVEAAEELVKALPEEREDKNQLLLVWAGRAATSGRPAIATNMLDAMSAPPPDNAWRVEATKGIIAIAEGRNDDGIGIFSALASAGAPADGLSDALATACGMTKDAEVAKTLAGSVESVAAARCLAAVDSTDVAKAVVPDGPYKTFLEN